MDELSIAIPASLVSDTPHLREKTTKIGAVGRAASIFGVDEIIIFPDLPNKSQQKEIHLITTILSYMETPQYLRKRLFKIQPELRYVGVLPPLRTPHHPLSNRTKDLVDNEYREGATVSHDDKGTLVDVGVEQHVLVPNRTLPIDTRVTVKIKKAKYLEAEIADRYEITKYWGYRLPSSGLPLGELLRKRAFDLVIATSKYGKPIVEILSSLRSHWEASHKILIAFGAPAQGLFEIAKQENMNLDVVSDFIINTIPNQRVETVRTEEALFATLGILTSMVNKG
ncbi:MAG: RNA-binding protein [Candidatus Bathyarchaeota archaeon]|nr:MAG: RNA-binding protein [Candidatus Bathyarchaeota archaeon]